MTNAQRILDLLAQQPGLDDDEISRLTDVRPRQQVNMICRRLADEGLLIRKRGASGKIGNFPTSASSSKSPPPSTRRVAPTASFPTVAAARTQPRLDLARADLRKALILMPCSGRKIAGGGSDTGCSPLTDDLPSAVSRRLADARGAVLGRAVLNDSDLVPAWRRYAGSLYEQARLALEDAVDAGLHVLIISGGYGLIKACEPIAYYEARLKLSDWPAGLLEEVLVAYANRHELESIWAFVSQTTDYRRLVTRTRWRNSSVREVVVITPEAARGAMVKAPRAQGEAIAAFLAGQSFEHWQSSDGLRLNCYRLW